MAQKVKVRRRQRGPAPAVRRPAATKVDAEEASTHHIAAQKVSEAITSRARARADVSGDARADGPDPA